MNHNFNKPAFSKSKRNILFAIIGIVLLGSVISKRDDNDKNDISQESVTDLSNQSGDDKSIKFDSEANAYMDSVREEMAKEELRDKIPDELYGIYEGTQPQHYLMNSNGDEMVVGGQRIPMPPLFYFFSLGENRSAFVEEVTMENERYVYEGDYEVLEQDDNLVVLRLNMSGGDTKTTILPNGQRFTEKLGSKSTPKYTLKLQKNRKSGTAKHDQSPEFKIKRSK